MNLPNPVWRRYVLSVQYHGSSFLGFSYQYAQEDCILPNGTDLRGYLSVEGRLRRALDSIGNPRKRRREHSTAMPSFSNVQVSSRTDRGVHALKNTLHVDLPDEWEPNRLVQALNYHLTRQPASYYGSDEEENEDLSLQQQQPTNTRWSSPRRKRRGNIPAMMDLRVLNAKLAPLWMDNPYHATHDPTQPPQVPWNARFSATRRVYAYRIVHPSGDGSSLQSALSEAHLPVTFEWDRSWVLPFPLHVEAMQEAAQHLHGSLDMSSFRAAHCQRQSPIVTLEPIHIHQQQHATFMGDVSSGFQTGALLHSTNSSMLLPTTTTLTLAGNAFVYRQVRNLVGCLVEVGRGILAPSKVLDILEARNRTSAPRTAPPEGLFLVNVEHGDFEI
jgi:tRNA pseudouridine(38-40) synthase